MMEDMQLRGSRQGRRAHTLLPCASSRTTIVASESAASRTISKSFRAFTTSPPGGQGRREQAFESARVRLREESFRSWAEKNTRDVDDHIDVEG